VCVIIGDYTPFTVGYPKAIEGKCNTNILTRMPYYGIYNLKLVKMVTNKQASELWLGLGVQGKMIDKSLIDWMKIS
jgi:hypothetical protein